MAHFARPRQWEIAAKILFRGRICGLLAEKCCRCYDGAFYLTSLLGETWSLILEVESMQCALVTYW